MSLEAPALKYAKRALSRAKAIQASADSPAITEAFLIDDLEMIIRFLTPEGDKSYEPREV